jgi:CBS domain containing-hemolysin-like protein
MNMPDWLTDTLGIIGALILVFINAFFVAAEFALVKVRGGQLDALVKQRRPFAATAQWLGQRLDASLSACQLGITMTSLGLGWVGEPAFAHLLRPLFELMRITSPTVIHTAAFIVAFTVITALHLVIGEQAPKIFAIRRPELLALWSAVPLKVFYVLSFPLLVALNGTTSFLLRLVGIETTGGHEVPHSEDEIRALLAQAHFHGKLTRSEHRLLNAVFEFDDLICRRVMLPRSDVVYFNVDHTVPECIEMVRLTKHTRYPVCEGSLDKVVGIVHIKDLLGISADESASLRSIMRPPRRVPDTMPISRLLLHFQRSHQLMALVVDEYGIVIGIVTLENVIEQIVGSVEDEFDTEPPEIAPEGPGQFIVLGSASVDTVNRRLDLSLTSDEVDTFSGLLMARAGRILEAGDRLQLDGLVAEVLEIKGARATRIRVTLPAAQKEPT